MMNKEIWITIKNNLAMGKRDINVYHHHSRSAHMISHNSFITLPLKNIENNDYLYLSIVFGPGTLEYATVVKIPSWLNFEFLSEGKITVQHFNDETLLRIPPGLTGWQLKLTLPPSFINRSADNVYVYEE